MNINKMKMPILITVALIIFTLVEGKVTPFYSKAQEQDTIDVHANPVSAPTKAVSLTISAASSLKDAMEEIKSAYAKEQPNITICLNFGASGSLQQQIAQGAPVDIFISAATKQMNSLKEKKLLNDDTLRNLLSNRLVLIVPNTSNSVMAFEDLTSDKVKKIAIGEPKSVPAGQYGLEALSFLNIYTLVKHKIVNAKDAKEVLAWVETGNADAGLVFETDAKVSHKTKIVVTVPAGTHEAVIYPCAAINDSKNLYEAKEFLNFLYSSKAKPIFEKYGFLFIANKPSKQQLRLEVMTDEQ